MPFYILAKLYIAIDTKNAECLIERFWLERLYIFLAIF